MKKLKVKLTFSEMALGTAPNNKQIYSDYIGSNAPDAPSKEEEIAAIGTEEYEEKQMTVYPRLEDGTPFYWDYQLKGYFKDACGSLVRCKGETFSKHSCALKAYKKIIDTCVFVDERKIPIDMKGGSIGMMQRPLRASTPLGERIALSSSETIPAGSEIIFTITVLSDQYVAAVKEWLDYGAYRGLSQWRNAGWGRFTYEILNN